MADIWFDVDAALAEVPVNILPLLDDTDFKTVEDAVAYNAAGMDLRWNFVTTAGAFTSTAVTPTTAGVHDWGNQGDGIYTVEIPDTGGTVNNDTEGFGWWSGKITGVLPFRGPICGFRAAAINNSMIDGTSIVVNAAASVWNALRADYATVDTFGDVQTPADVTADLLGTAVPGSFGAGTVGKVIGDIAAVGVILANSVEHGGSSSVLTLKRVLIANTTDGETALDISSSGTGNAHAVNILATGGGKGVAIGAASVGLSVDSSAADDLQVGGTELSALINAQVVDALVTDTHAELAAVPAATSSIKDMLKWVFMLARNKKTQTATTSTLRNDADSGNIGTSTVSDDGTTFTSGEWA